MKNFLLLAFASMAMLSVSASTASHEPADVGKLQCLNPETTVVSSDVVLTSSCIIAHDFEFTCEVVKTNYRVSAGSGFEFSPAEVLSSYHIAPVRKYWNVPRSIGVPDTKRHIKWQFFVRKLC